MPQIKTKHIKKGKHWTDVVISREGKEKICSRVYVLEQGESINIKERAVKFLSERFKKGWGVGFNTNYYHVVRFITEDDVVAYPINFNTLWTANDLLKQGKVKTIEILPVTQTGYRQLVKAWREYELSKHF